MNTQHLQYLIEIERTRSVSQAAENLFIGQPNLSRILHEMEANLGFKIFVRTSIGARATERGAIFLQHAKSIIRELERIDALGPRHPVENRLRICIPRAAFILDLTADYLNTLPVAQNLDSVVRECHARQAIEMLENGEVEVGIIRFRSEYRDYFEEQSVSRGFGFQILSRYRYQLLLPKTHAQAEQQLKTALGGGHGVQAFQLGPQKIIDQRQPGLPRGHPHRHPGAARKDQRPLPRTLQCAGDLGTDAALGHGQQNVIGCGGIVGGGHAVTRTAQHARRRLLAGIVPDLANCCRLRR